MKFSIKTVNGHGENEKEVSIPWYDILITGFFGALITGIVMFFVSVKKED